MQRYMTDMTVQRPGTHRGPGMHTMSPGNIWRQRGMGDTRPAIREWRKPNSKTPAGITKA